MRERVAGGGRDVDEIDILIERWRSNCTLAGVTLTDDDIARARDTGGLRLVLEREALVRRLGAWAALPDYLDRAALPGGAYD